MNAETCTLCKTGSDWTGLESVWNELFTTQGFVPRWNCGHWPEWLGWLHIVADIGIFVAYAAIPASLLAFILRRRDVPLRGVFWLFIAFILSCGCTHLIDAFMFYTPAYRFLGVCKVVTAVVSLWTAVALIRLMPTMLTIPQVVKEHGTARAEVVQLRQTEQRLEVAREQLEERSAMLTVQDRRMRRSLSGARGAAVTWSAESGEILWDCGLSELLMERDQPGVKRTWSAFLTGVDVLRLREQALEALRRGRPLVIELDARLASSGESVRIRVRARADNAGPEEPGVITGLLAIIEADDADL